MIPPAADQWGCPFSCSRYPPMDGSDFTTIDFRAIFTTLYGLTLSCRRQVLPRAAPARAIPAAVSEKRRLRNNASCVSTKHAAIRAAAYHIDPRAARGQPWQRGRHGVGGLRRWRCSPPASFRAAIYERIWYKVDEQQHKATMRPTMPYMYPGRWRVERWEPGSAGAPGGRRRRLGCH